MPAFHSRRDRISRYSHMRNMIIKKFFINRGLMIIFLAMSIPTVFVAFILLSARNEIILSILKVELLFMLLMFLFMFLKYVVAITVSRSQHIDSLLLMLKYLHEERCNDYDLISIENQADNSKSSIGARTTLGIIGITALVTLMSGSFMEVIDFLVNIYDIKDINAISSGFFVSTVLFVVVVHFLKEILYSDIDNIILIAVKECRIEMEMEKHGMMIAKEEELKSSQSKLKRFFRFGRKQHTDKSARAWYTVFARSQTPVHQEERREQCSPKTSSTPSGRTGSV